MTLAHCQITYRRGIPWQYLAPLFFLLTQDGGGGGGGGGCQVGGPGGSGGGRRRGEWGRGVGIYVAENS